MNDQFKNNNQDDEFARKLHEVAEGTNANAHFIDELENKLKEAHQPKANWPMPAFKKITPALSWVAFVIVFGFVLSWSIRNLIPAHQPGANTTPGKFVCPVTQPNGSQPPNESTVDSNYLGNGQLWTGLWPDGKIYMTPDFQRADGSFDMKWGWWRAVPGETLTIEGHRLDANADPLQAEIPEGYSGNFQVAGLIFPTTGCWEVTGRVGDASLTFVTEVIFGEATPTPNAAIIQSTATPNATMEANHSSYDWRGTKLYLNAPLPDVPTTASIYLLKGDEPATLDSARALANQFGIQGEVYLSPGLYPAKTSYFITDGKQSLTVASNLLFTYTADMKKTNNNFTAPTNPNAESIINHFLQAHGFNSPHKIAPASLYGGYEMEPLSPDGFPMRYEYYSSRPMHITLDENGQVLQVESNWMDYESTGTQTYGIITAKEAFQKLLDDTVPAGKIESSHSSSFSQAKEWKRAYPSNETITIYGYAYSIPAFDSTKPSFTQIDGYTATGNTNGFDALPPNTYVEAKGQFVTENGIEQFKVVSWRASPYQQDGLVGTLRRENGQLLLKTDQEELTVQPDIPADVPLPFENIFIVGTRKGNIYDWTLIDNRATSSGGGGGGGGGGLGFYKLNLSGTPVPFPTATPIASSSEGNYTVQAGDTVASIADHFGITIDQLAQANNLSDTNLIIIGQKLIIPGATSTQPNIGQKFEGQRGLMNITIYTKPDGSQRVEYILSYVPENPPYPYRAILEGTNLEQLQAYQNRPVNIWGAVTRLDQQSGMPVLKVERFEIPFPDLQFQILQGTEKNITVAGQSYLLFTTDDGVSYIEYMPGVERSPMGKPGDEALLEALAVPDETIGGYPTLRVFSSAMAISPKNGKSVELTITANQIYTSSDEPPTTSVTENNAVPTLTIEKVELMYYVTNPHWQIDHLDGTPLYIQPVWKFYGHYSNGDEFEVIVQALKPEDLLPELAPYIQGG